MRNRKTTLKIHTRKNILSIKSGLIGAKNGESGPGLRVGDSCGG